MKKLLALLFLVFCLHTKAQLVYVDVNPDSCTCVTSTSPTSSVSAVAYWDLDHDGIYDFKTEAGTYASDCMHGSEVATLIPLANNQTADGSSGILRLNAGDTVNNQLMSIANRLEYFDEFSGWSGFWHNANLNVNGFAGIKFYSGSTLYYGWMQLVVVAVCGQASVTVKDYAYSTSLITANEGSTASIQKNKAQQAILIYPNPAQYNFTIQTSNNDKQLINVFDVTGKVVLSQNINGTTTIDGSKLSEGVYYISISSNQGVINKKLVIVK